MAFKALVVSFAHRLNSIPVFFSKKYSHISPYTWAFLEFIFGGCTMFAAYQLTPAIPAESSYRHLATAYASLAYGSILAVTAHALGLHSNLTLKGRYRIVILCVCSALLSLTLLLTISTFVFYSQIGRIILSLCAIGTILIGGGLRLLLRRHTQESPLLVSAVGDESFESYIRELTSSGAQSIQLLKDQPTSRHYDIVVIQDHLLGSVGEISCYLQVADKGLQVFTATAFVETYFYRIPIQYISPAWLFSIDFRHLHPFFHSVKRAQDIVLAGFGLFLSLPIVLLAMCAIRLESSGPVLYSQIRVGLFQRHFRIWKLRTMRVNSECSGPQWAAVSDSRITWVGKILRKTRIDELPQFWNILRGDMALVGPRPERPEFVEQLANEIPYYRQRHLVKPGLTGWAQICYPYGANVLDARNKLSYDFYYIKNYSLILDLQIMVQTIGAITRGSR